LVNDAVGAISTHFPAGSSGAIFVFLAISFNAYLFCKSSVVSSSIGSILAYSLPAANLITIVPSE